MEIILYALLSISIVLMVWDVRQISLRHKGFVSLSRERSKRNEKRLEEQQAMYAKAINKWEDEQEKHQTLYWKIKNGIYD